MTRTGYLYRAALLLVLGIFLMGMGNAGSPGQGAAESPFNAKIKDTSNNEVTITSASFDGKTTFNVYMGKGRVEIPFDTISRIEVKEGSACATIKATGTMCNLKTNSISKIYGKLPYGTYQIAFKDVVWIELTKAKQ
jgi:hypothetical protein